MPSSLIMKSGSPGRCRRSTRAADDVEERRAELRLAVGLVERPVVHDRAGGPGEVTGSPPRAASAARGRCGSRSSCRRPSARRPARPVACAGPASRHHRVGEQVLQRAGRRAGVSVWSVGGGAHESWRSSSARATGRCRARRLAERHVEVRVVLEDVAPVRSGPFASRSVLVAGFRPARHEHPNVLAGEERHRHAVAIRVREIDVPARASTPGPCGSSARCARRT